MAVTDLFSDDFVNPKGKILAEPFVRSSGKSGFTVRMSVMLKFNVLAR